MKRFKSNLIFGGAHLLAVIVTGMVVAQSSKAQGALIWFIFLIPDFPISLCYGFAGPGYSEFLHSIEHQPWAMLFYGPHLIHGVAGTVWWFLLPSIYRKLTRKSR